MGTAIVAWTRGGTPVRVGVFVDVYMGAEDARAVKPFETPGRTLYAAEAALSERAPARRYPAR